jgi:hypothetical protein
MNHYFTMSVKKRDTPMDPLDLSSLWDSFVPEIQTSWQDKDGKDSKFMRLCRGFPLSLRV